ncbi:regulator of G protein signaling like 1 [Phyllostomus discolor]|uniref:Regulator of G protein signaling like 1 n=1 Tax=Phyllostomus discolor TaxID=89673 RepID=A0A834DE80_9CHIR|nr:regulator of G protein signaling like 1 [Phyllostomus discolor]
MNNVEIIGSTNLLNLLEDEVFADFFNTFLSLPVFGQTPFYTVENAEWGLWPEIPHDLISKYTGFLTWLGKYRLPFFCKTNLCFHYILCQELISFINSPEGAHMMKWKRADQWLLQKCIGGVRGMWRFCTYLKGSAGEELVDFWILAEKILSIDEMDQELRDYYLSLLLVLKATHLKEGSRVVALCNMNIKSFLNFSIWHPNQSTTRREILSNMQKVALFKIQSYWLPNFYTHAKTIIAKEESCQGLMQEYETRLCSICCTHEGELPVNMSIKNSHHLQKQYSSRKTKRKMWRLTGHASWSLELDTKPDTNCMFSQEICPQETVTQMPSQKKISLTDRVTRSLEKDILSAKKSKMKKIAKSRPHMEGLFETKFSAHLRTLTPIISHYPQMTIKKAIKQRLSVGYTHWALCADACAGGPFRDHLKKLNLKVELRLLDLWHDLHHFLSVQMTNRKTGNSFFWHLLGNRICELYLNEQIGPCLPLKSQTIKGLKELLPSGDVNPWILRAQEEICQILSSWYDEFLDEEDYWFLTCSTQAKFISPKWRNRESTSKKENVLLYKRFEESLALSQGLANMEEMDSMQWHKLASEDLRQGGSLRVEMQSPVLLTDTEKMPFEELCYKYPKVAIQRISDDYKIYCEKAPKTDLTVQVFRQPKIRSPTERKISFLKKGNIVRKPSLRPRNLAEVLLSPQQLEFFMEFLKERKAESPLQFLIAVQKMSLEADETVCKSIIENIMNTFFYGKIPPEEMLQCDAPIIRDISQMRRVSRVPLLALQDYIMKSLEERWFKEYQDLFPNFPQEVQAKVRTLPRKPSKPTATQLHTSQKKCWQKMVSFIKSFCKYRRVMSDANIRPEFEEFLHMEINNSKENISPPPRDTPGRLPPHHPNIRSADENGDIPLVKRRILGHRIIIVNFAMNDLYFFSEIQKFNDLVSSAHVMQVSRAYNENDVALMRAKLSIILSLYLHSEVPPKLKVNISETQKDSIFNAISEGHLDRTVFHGATMSLFPIIMYFWKRFCVWRVARSYLQHKGMVLKDGKATPKGPYKFPPCGGGFEWVRIQQRDVVASSAQNSSSSNLTQPKTALSTLQVGSSQGLLPRTKSGVSGQRSQTDIGTSWVHLWERQVRKTMGDLAGDHTEAHITHSDTRVTERGRGKENKRD